jgi:ribonuclease VapC
MMVLDSSVLVAIIKGEPEAEQLLHLLAREDGVLGTPTLVETRVWCTINRATSSPGWLEDFINTGPAVIPFSREMADTASAAFATFGRGSGHPAKLNFGDCMAYAVAAVLRAPLLFKGADFSHTDVMAHPASIRT